MSIEDVEEYIDAVATRIRSRGVDAGGADYVRILRAADAMVTAADGGRHGRAAEAPAAPVSGEHELPGMTGMSRQQRRASARAQAKKKRKESGR